MYIQAGNHPDFWLSLFQQAHVRPHMIPEFLAAAPSQQLSGSDRFCGTRCAWKPYVGVQFASIPEFPVGTAVLPVEIKLQRHCPARNLYSRWPLAKLLLIRS
jgi:hypothetical protein